MTVSRTSGMIITTQTEAAGHKPAGGPQKR